MLPELEDYDWQQAFGYVGEPGTYAGKGYQPKAVMGAEHVSLAPVTREDVREILRLAPGENEDRPWLGVFLLNDGRFLFLNAGCDYTGWDCQASGEGFVADDLNHLIRFGTSIGERMALGWTLPEDPPL